MKFFDVHPDDARWLRRWLRSNVLCFGLIICFALAIRFDPVASHEARSAGQAESSELAALPPETDLVLLTSRDLNPIAPQGWRRTARGWEHVSSWSMPRPLGEIIASQRSREPVWMQMTLAKLRNVPPLFFALLQIIAVAVIVAIARRRSESLASIPRRRRP